jgi:hypothetical protein
MSVYVLGVIEHIKLIKDLMILIQMDQLVEFVELFLKIIGMQK